MKHVLFAGVAACFALSASAESSLGIDVNKTSYEDSSFEAQSNNISLAYQYRFQDNFSIVGKVGFKAHEDNIDILGSEAKFSIDYLASVFVKYDLMPKETFNAYGLIGYSQAKFQAKNNIFRYEETDSDLSYGLGADYEVAEDIRLYVEAVQLIDTSDAELRSYNIGVQVNF
ncbi:porin family protein [Pleionea sediminis]|uniref:porin family protein n=1 Tax=Pleionea sediminis TaxID=2569479 RepID=UPI00118480DC|nr:porin family protein [Pleionea sediminis]